MRAKTPPDSKRDQKEKLCCLLDGGEQCRRSAGNAYLNACFIKTAQQRNLQLTQDPLAQNSRICDHHKQMIQQVRTKRKRQESMEVQESQVTDQNEPQVAFTRLPASVLRKYKRQFNIPHRAMGNKLQLAEKIAAHFKEIPVNERETLTYFFYKVKCGSEERPPPYDRYE